MIETSVELAEEDLARHLANDWENASKLLGALALWDGFRTLRGIAEATADDWVSTDRPQKIAAWLRALADEIEFVLGEKDE